MYKYLDLGHLVKIHHLFGIIVEVIVSEQIPNTIENPYYVVYVDGYRICLVREAFDLIQSL